MNLMHTAIGLLNKIRKTKAPWVLFVDAIALLIGVINGFFLPKVFSMEGYAVFKAFSLYATYAAVFSLGLSDGLYIVFGGRKENEIDPAQLKAYYIFLVKLQLVLFALLVVIFATVLKDKAFMLFVFFVFPLQLVHFFRLYFRATGGLLHYAKAQGFIVFLELLDTVLIVWVLKSKSADLFIVLKIINHLLLAGVLTYFLRKYTYGIKPAKMNFSQYLKIMKTGIYVLLADALVLLIFSMDRWFVMFAFDTKTFAWYSFAVSIMNIFLMLITSITNILYSYMSQNIDNLHIRKRIRQVVFMCSGLFPLGYFIVKPIIINFLPSYNESLTVLWVLMLGLPLISVLNIFYNNLYKVTGRVKYYLKKMVVILLVSVSLNIVATYIFKSPQAISAAMLATYIIWIIYSAQDRKIKRAPSK